MSKSNKGFVGNAASRYFKTVGELMKKGEDGVRDGESFKSNSNFKIILDPRALDAKKSGKQYEGYSRRLTGANEKLISSITSYSVVVDEQKLDYVYSGMEQTKKDISQKVDYVITQLETLCKEKYIIPETTPKVEALLLELRKVLPEFETLSEETKRIIGEYANTIVTIDK